MLFRGVATAIVTPFLEDESVDLVAFRNLLEIQIQEGVNAIVVLGTTGECPTLEYHERAMVIQTAVEVAAKRVAIIVGTGTNSTRQSCLFAKQAETLGADGQMVVGPAYNKPTQVGFERHVAAVLEASPLPCILYNVPGRTQFNIEPETILTLANRHPQIVGIKEASGDLSQVMDLISRRPSGLAVYSGDDELAFPIACLGGDGVISVLSNVLPRLTISMMSMALSGLSHDAREIHYHLIDAMRACFIESNPIPVKAILHAQGLIQNELRLPLLPLSRRGQIHLQTVMPIFKQETTYDFA